MPSFLAFLHTARPNIDLFQQLAGSIDPSVPIRHQLIEDVLRDAVGTGVVTETMRDETARAIRALADAGATLVLCTCSTIGGVAESVAADSGVRVMRVDRPMAEAAVASGRHVVVAATLPSTLRPTVQLLQHVAAEAHRTLTITERLCADAWPHFERGDREAYARAIADAMAMTTPADVVVLAQASMAPAAALIEARGILALSSPELGVRAALNAYRRPE